MRRRILSITILLITFSIPVLAQLPADAVELGKVKISEVQKSTDLCPVYLVPSDPQLPTWEYKGVTYRGSKADAKDKFLKDPEVFAKVAEKQRFVNNFITAMSTIWCPVTDQLTPGGMKQWKVGSLTFESCCAFCDESGKEADFAQGLDKLKERAEKSYALMGAHYTEGAKSPVEGAIKKP